MTGLTHSHFPVMLVDDEVQALNSFELTLRSSNMNHFISVQDSRSEKNQIAFSAKLPTLKQAEQLLIEEALRRSNGNQSIAALSPGISEQAINKRLHKTDG